jgi:hypothetical protein
MLTRFELLHQLPVAVEEAALEFKDDKFVTHARAEFRRCLAPQVNVVAHKFCAARGADPVGLAGATFTSPAKPHRLFACARPAPRLAFTDDCESFLFRDPNLRNSNGDRPEAAGLISKSGKTYCIGRAIQATRTFAFAQDVRYQPITWRKASESAVCFSLVKYPSR